MFTQDGYRMLLDAFLEAGYEFRFFNEAFSKQGTVYLRHDLDFCIDYALPIALIEKDRNIKSTYFVLINSKLYNLFESDSIRKLKSISDMGHMISLHVDERALNTQEDFKRLMDSFTNVLPFASSQIISRHRPDIRSPASSWLPNECMDVYCKPFFKDIEYASDSRGEWKYGYPTDREAFKKKRSFQLLTHPLWWVHDNCFDNKEKIHLLLDHIFAESEQSLSFLN